MKFQGDILNFYDFIQVFVFTTNHHLNFIVFIGILIGLSIIGVMFCSAFSSECSSEQKFYTNTKYCEETTCANDSAFNTRTNKTTTGACSKVKENRFSFLLVSFLVKCIK